MSIILGRKIHTLFTHFKITAMKRYMVFIVVVFHPIMMLAQDVAIMFSTNWSVGKEIFQPDSRAPYPELVISYINLSDKYYYFKKLSDKRMDYPIISYWTSMRYSSSMRPDTKTLAMGHGDYSNERMIVCVNNWHQNWENGWEIYMESTYETAVIKGEEYEMDFVNDESASIIDYLVERDLGVLNMTVKERQAWFAEQKEPPINYLFPTALNAQRMIDSTKAFIWENRERFVFLAPYETVRDTFNLAAFAELGGEYLFEMLTDSITPCLPVYNEEKGDFKDIPFPDEINGYKMFVGHVFSNKVSMKLQSFGSKKKE